MRSTLTLSVGRSRPFAARSRNSSTGRGPSTVPPMSMYHSSAILREVGYIGDRVIRVSGETEAIEPRLPLRVPVYPIPDKLASFLGIQFIQLCEESLNRWSVGGRLAHERKHHVPLLVQDVR